MATKFPECLSDLNEIDWGGKKPPITNTIKTRKGTYDRFTADLAKYPHQQENPQIIDSMYCALGLVGEAGEFSEKIKKWHRDGVLKREDAALELGDVLYYLTRSANILGFTLKQIEEMNRKKLTSREKRGKIHGSGDRR